MWLADSNVWLALALSKHAFHSVAGKWLGDLARRDKALFCRATQQSFLRLMSTAAVLSPYDIPPLTNDAAWSIFDDLLADERVAWADEPRGLQSHWKRLSGASRASPKVWMDAYLAAFAIAGGFGLVTTDKAFKQFDGLKLVLLSKP